jgi:hypothetical protein
VEKLMFYEIAEGSLAEQAQKDFEEAQAIVHQRGVPVKISIEITVHPESREHRGTAAVEYKTRLQAPPRKSIKHITELNKEGTLVDSGHRQGNMFKKEETK